MLVWLVAGKWPILITYQACEGNRAELVSDRASTPGNNLSFLQVTSQNLSKGKWGVGGE